jgi:PilZ domain-containing protein
MSSVTPSPGTDVIAERNWYPQRSGLRYNFIATVEVTDPKSGTKVVSKTANLSSYGCHISTDTPFRPGTMIRLKITAKGKAFRSDGKVIYSISKEGMGIRFDNVESAEQVILNEWLMHASSTAQERRPLESPSKRKSPREQKIVFALSLVVLVAIVVGLFAWFGLLP